LIVSDVSRRPEALLRERTRAPLVATDLLLPPGRGPPLA
jgi:hypothetical protein